MFVYRAGSRCKYERTLHDGGGESTDGGGESTHGGGESTDGGGESTDRGGESTDGGGESTVGVGRVLMGVGRVHFFKYNSIRKFFLAQKSDYSLQLYATCM